MGSRSLDSIVQEFEDNIRSADSKLDHLGWRIDTLELRNIPTAVADEATHLNGEESTTNEESDQEILLLRELLTELAQLKQSYASLRSELQQVHTMHADLTQALKQKVVQVQDVFSNLRTRFLKHGKDFDMN